MCRKTLCFSCGECQQVVIVKKAAAVGIFWLTDLRSVIYNFINLMLMLVSRIVKNAQTEILIYFITLQRAGGCWKAGTWCKSVSLPSSIPESEPDRYVRRSQYWSGMAEIAGSRILRQDEYGMTDGPVIKALGLSEPEERLRIFAVSRVVPR